MAWTFGTYSWFVVVALCGVFASFATVINQKVVKAAEKEKQRQIDMGQKPEVAKPVPTIWSQWDMVTNLKGLIYPRRVNSSV
jgi:hypothetical protein